MRFSSSVATIAIVGVFTLGVQPAAAVPARVGIVGGYQVTSSDFDVLGERHVDLQPGGAGLIGVRFGLELVPALALEITLQLAPARIPIGETVLLMPIHADLVLRPFAGAFTPFIALGGGVYAHLAGTGSGDVDGLIHGALGVEARLREDVLLRLEAAVLATDGVASTLSYNPAVRLGLDLRFGARPSAEVVVPEPVGVPGDRDGDGVPDDRDHCPSHPGPPAHDGCPDTDGDGIRDVWDRCPMQPGSPAHEGCPDTDGDGLIDRLDACPRAPGSPRSWGCPL